MNQGNRIYLFAATFMLSAMMFSSTASAVSIAFRAYNAVPADLDLTVDVTVSNGQAFFEFANNSTGDSAGSSLARIYFEAGLTSFDLFNGTVMGGTGTHFMADFPGPNSPPGGNNVVWTGVLASFGAVAPPPHNGLGVGDSLLIVFDYAGTLDALVTALQDESGNARIAGHVLDCVGGDSCSVTTVVPVPAALPLMLSGLAGLGFLARRRRA